MTALYDPHMDTPIGPFTIVVDDDGAVLASGWTADSSAPAAADPPGPARGEPLTADATSAPVDPGRPRPTTHGDLTALDAIAVRQHTGGAFLRRGLEDAARGASRATPSRYTELAAPDRATRPRSGPPPRPAPATPPPCSCRATGCIRTDGTLGGFRWGLDVKRWLLAHESAGERQPDSRTVASRTTGYVG